jgi:uncharacterized protein YidB (DUF937 family)
MGTRNANTLATPGERHHSAIGNDAQRTRVAGGADEEITIQFPPPKPDTKPAAPSSKTSKSSAPAKTKPKPTPQTSAMRGMIAIQNFANGKPPAKFPPVFLEAMKNVGGVEVDESTQTATYRGMELSLQNVSGRSVVVAKGPHGSIELRKVTWELFNKLQAPSSGGVDVAGDADSDTTGASLRKEGHSVFVKDADGNEVEVVFPAPPDSKDIVTLHSSQMEGLELGKLAFQIGGLRQKLIEKRMESRTNSGPDKSKLEKEIRDLEKQIEDLEKKMKAKQKSAFANFTLDPKNLKRSNSAEYRFLRGLQHLQIPGVQNSGVDEMLRHLQAQAEGREDLTRKNIQDTGLNADILEKFIDLMETPLEVSDNDSQDENGILEQFASLEGNLGQGDNVEAKNVRKHVFEQGKAALCERLGPENGDLLLRAMKAAGGEIGAAMQIYEEAGGTWPPEGEAGKLGKVSILGMAGDLFFISQPLDPDDLKSVKAMANLVASQNPETPIAVVTKSGTIEYRGYNKGAQPLPDGEALPANALALIAPGAKGNENGKVWKLVSPQHLPGIPTEKPGDMSDEVWAFIGEHKDDGQGAAMLALFNKLGGGKSGDAALRDNGIISIDGGKAVPTAAGGNLLKAVINASINEGRLDALLEVAAENPKGLLGQLATSDNPGGLGKLLQAVASAGTEQRTILLGRAKANLKTLLWAFMANAQPAELANLVQTIVDVSAGNERQCNDLIILARANPQDLMKLLEGKKIPQDLGHLLSAMTKFSPDSREHIALLNLAEINLRGLLNIFKDSDEIPDNLQHLVDAMAKLPLNSEKHAALRNLARADLSGLLELFNDGIPGNLGDLLEPIAGKDNGEAFARVAARLKKGGATMDDLIAAAKSAKGKPAEPPPAPAKPADAGKPAAPAQPPVTKPPATPPGAGAPPPPASKPAAYDPTIAKRGVKPGADLPQIPKKQPRGMSNGLWKWIQSNSKKGNKQGAAMMALFNMLGGGNGAEATLVNRGVISAAGTPTTAGENLLKAIATCKGPQRDALLNLADADLSGLLGQFAGSNKIPDGLQHLVDAMANLPPNGEKYRALRYLTLCNLGAVLEIFKGNVEPGKLNELLELIAGNSKEVRGALGAVVAKLARNANPTMDDLIAAAGGAGAPPPAVPAQPPPAAAQPVPALAGPPPAAAPAGPPPITAEAAKPDGMSKELWTWIQENITNSDQRDILLSLFKANPFAVSELPTLGNPATENLKSLLEIAGNIPNPDKRGILLQLFKANPAAVSKLFGGGANSDKLNELLVTDIGTTGRIIKALKSDNPTIDDLVAAAAPVTLLTAVPPDAGGLPPPPAPAAAPAQPPADATKPADPPAADPAKPAAAQPAAAPAAGLPPITAATVKPGDMSEDLWKWIQTNSKDGNKQGAAMLALFNALGGEKALKDRGVISTTGTLSTAGRNLLKAIVSNGEQRDALLDLAKANLGDLLGQFKGNEISYNLQNLLEALKSKKENSVQYDALLTLAKANLGGLLGQFKNGAISSSLEDLLKAMESKTENERTALVALASANLGVVLVWGAGCKNLNNLLAEMARIGTSSETGKALVTLAKTNLGDILLKLFEDSENPADLTGLNNLLAEMARIGTSSETGKALVTLAAKDFDGVLGLFKESAKPAGLQNLLEALKKLVDDMNWFQHDALLTLAKANLGGVLGLFEKSTVPDGLNELLAALRDFKQTTNLRYDALLDLAKTNLGDLLGQFAKTSNTTRSLKNLLKAIAENDKNRYAPLLTLAKANLGGVLGLFEKNTVPDGLNELINLIAGNGNEAALSAVAAKLKEGGTPTMDDLIAAARAAK